MYSYLPKDMIRPDSPDQRVKSFIRDAHTWKPEGYLFDKGAKRFVLNLYIWTTWLCLS